jgi:uncharacterized protein YjbJ (UPF0337 family)
VQTRPWFSSFAISSRFVFPTSNLVFAQDRLNRDGPSPLTLYIGVRAFLFARRPNKIRAGNSIHLNLAFYRRAVELTFMNSSTTDKVKGTAKEVAGKVKEETGKAIGNPDLRDRGTAEKVAGKVERKVGEVKKVFGK